MRRSALAAAASLAVVTAGGALSGHPGAIAQEPGETVTAVLERFAADYADDVSRVHDVTFGVELEGAWWTVTSGGPDTAVTVNDGAPAAPTFYFTLDRATLDRVDSGELASLTAMAKARESDVTPMDMDTMEGFAPGEGFYADLLSVAFHFWTRGAPEVIRYGSAHTREVHGANAAVFYYQPGFRSAWFSISPGQHANADPADQTNPFLSLFVVTRGAGDARIGGREMTLSEGEAILIPPGVAHEFWNDGDAAMEGVLLMFGDGA